MTHHTHPPRLIGAVTVIAVAGLTLAGCTSMTSPASNASAPTATTKHSDQAAPATNSPSEAATSAAPNASPGTRSGLCTSAQLTGRLGEEDGKPAGSGLTSNPAEQLSVILTNTSSTPCTLQGWPGVSFVGDGNGTQIGASAIQRDAPHPTVTLRQEESAQAYLAIFDAATFKASACKPVAADGLRVYPPGSKTSLFIKGGARGDGKACSNVQFGLLNVAAFVPYP